MIRMGRRGHLAGQIKPRKEKALHMRVASHILIIVFIYSMAMAATPLPTPGIPVIVVDSSSGENLAVDLINLANNHSKMSMVRYQTLDAHWRD